MGRLFNSDASGTWTPALTFATPGNLSVAYSTQVGTWRRQGSIWLLDFTIITSTFTHTSASGNLHLTGSPVLPVLPAVLTNNGSLAFQGITKVGYTQITPQMANADPIMVFMASSSALGVSYVAAADCPTGTTKIIIGSIRINA